MGISFRLSKSGKRFRSKPILVQEETGPSSEESKESSGVLVGAGSKREVDNTEAANDTGEVSPEHEVSFTLNLYPKGYSIGKPTEIEDCQTLLQDVKPLHPYDKASKTLFSAIESGWLPGDILDDIPTKYFDGAIVCQVRDYRDHISEQGTATTSFVMPVLRKVRLRMSLENVIKDMPFIADDSWTYSDLMEVEARILKVLQPCLCLDPTPMLDRLCKDPSATKLNLSFGRKRKLQQIAEVTVTANNQNFGKSICTGRKPGNPICGQGGLGTSVCNASLQQVYENISMQHGSSGVPSFRRNNVGLEATRQTLPLHSEFKLQPVINSSAIAEDRASGLPGNFSGVNAKMSLAQNMISSYADTAGSNSAISLKRENPDAQLTPLAAMKKQKQTPARLDDIQQQQQTGPPLVGLTGTDMQWKNQLPHSQPDIKGIQHSSTWGGQRYTLSVMNNVPNNEPGAPFFNQQRLRYGANEEHLDRQETERPKEALPTLDSDNSLLDLQQLQAQHLQQHSSMRNHPPTAVEWQDGRPIIEDIVKDDVLQRRISMPSPRVPSGPMVQSPVSSKLGEISCGSLAGQFSGVRTVSALGVQKDKLTEITNASVSNMNAPLAANSPSTAAAPMGDQVILERFAKIGVVAQRHQLNVKKNKVDHYPARETVQYSTQQLAFYLSDSFNCEDYTDQTKPMSRSLIGGSTTTCKARSMSFMRNEEMSRVPTRLLMTEKPFDGTVSMQYGFMDDSVIHDYQLTLPTNHHADLLAAQFGLLMERDGYQKTDDQIRPIPIRMVAPNKLAPVSGMLLDNTASQVKQPELATGQPLQVAAPAMAKGMVPMNVSQNPSNHARMLTSVNDSQALGISQGYIPGTAIPTRMQQVDQYLFQQQQQQPPWQQQQLQPTLQSRLQQQQKLSFTHVHTSSPPLTMNPLSQIMNQTSNLPMSTNQMVKPSPLQLQMQQQQQAGQQQQPQISRKVMMGISQNISMGNVGNNVMSLGLSNALGIGGPHGVSSPTGSISGSSNISPHEMNLASASNFSPGLRPSSLSHAQAASAAMAIKLRMAQQNRAGPYVQSGIAGMPGNTNQMLPSSAGLLGALNRANLSSLQLNAMLPMGPPKLSGANFYLNPQQQLQHQQLQQQQQQQHQMQQVSSPLQQPQVGSPPMVGSPSVMVMQHQHISPQQLSQQTAMSPQQLSSGAFQPTNNSGNPVAGPASPQLSSQTHGSVGSITSSPHGSASRCK
ncbi:Spt20 family [Musa troglodytarum]|uniref:Spt20 family n=1 Tax=Musa troglodytarum TaxID=320322 RepID=A0A9E7KZ80_9LILI|nr:Spt20 family [Musa troglodytarum]